SIFHLSVFASPSMKSMFFDDSIIIYGTQNKDTIKQENNNVFNLKKKLKSYIDIVQDQFITESQLKNKNLIIFSSHKSNKILNFINLPNVKSNFPLEITDSSFIFNTKEYKNKNDSIVFIYPSPYNSKNYALFFYSNSNEGLENITESFSFNNIDYQIFSQNKLIKEGSFNKTGFFWKFDPNLEKEFK
ncbi:MAG: hypothetical protein ACK4IX_11415, partial [Candidatus Sericytochromatia bacterium]